MRGRPARRGTEDVGSGKEKPRGESPVGAEPPGGGCHARQAILRAARERFLYYGYKKTTIEEIATTAGVGKGTVYLHFDSKEAILLTLAREIKRNVTEQMRAICGSLAEPEEKLRRMIFTRIIAVHDAATATAHGLELVDEMMRPKVMECGLCEQEIQQGLIAAVLREGADKGQFSLPGDDETRAASLFSRTFLSFLPPYVNHCMAGTDCPRELERQVNEMVDFVLSGLRRRA
jgi:Transcriptional regulator